MWGSFNLYISLPHNQCGLHKIEKLYHSLTKYIRILLCTHKFKHAQNCGFPMKILMTLLNKCEKPLPHHHPKSLEFKTSLSTKPEFKIFHFNLYANHSLLIPLTAQKGHVLRHCTSPPNESPNPKKLIQRKRTLCTQKRKKIQFPSSLWNRKMSQRWRANSMSHFAHTRFSMLLPFQFIRASLIWP